MVFVDRHLEIGDGGFGEEGRIIDLFHGIEERFIEIGFRGDEEVDQDIGPFVEEVMIDALNFFIDDNKNWFEEAKVNVGPAIVEVAFFAEIPDIGIFCGQTGSISSWVTFIALEEAIVPQESNRDRDIVPAGPFVKFAMKGAGASDPAVHYALPIGAAFKM